MAEPKKGLDVIIGLGGGKPSPEPESASEDKGESESPDLPLDYVAAFNDYKKAQTAETFWEAVKSCMSAGEEMKKAGKPGGY